MTDEEWESLTEKRHHDAVSQISERTGWSIEIVDEATIFVNCPSWTLAKSPDLVRTMEHLVYHYVLGLTPPHWHMWRKQLEAP